ncbi:MAG: hypothetical protein PHW66_03305 [Gallionella sp.]|nr:hypothetical protein [Gallionella sp.]
MIHIDAVSIGMAELRHHLFVMQHRPGNQMREPGDEQQIVDEVVFAGDAAIDINQERYLGESEEGNAQRQDDIQRRNVATEKLVS